MNNDILKELKRRFPTYIRSKKYDYNVTVDDAKYIFELVNNAVFKGKLNIDDILITVDDMTADRNSKGDFYIINDGNYTMAISIAKRSFGDLFDNIVSTICHEMIHAYDYLYGDMRSILEDDGSINVSKYNGKQIVNGKYDAHGKFFEKYISIFDNFGIIVKKAYNLNDKKFMKNVNEKKANFFGEYIEESETIDDKNLKERLQKIANRIQCTKSTAELKYFDKNHWYIRID